MAVVSTPDGPVRPVDAGSCPRCGVPYGLAQEYCVACGLRLPAEPGLVPALGRAWRRRIAWYPGDWVWQAVGTLLVAAAATTVTIAVTRGGPGGLAGPRARSRPAATRLAPAASREKARATPAGGARRAGTTGGGLEATATVEIHPSAPASDLFVWPAGTTGYTVVLVSTVASKGGLAAARTAARRALRAGLPEAGVLGHGATSSVPPRTYLVFSGVYPSLDAAQTAAIQARAEFPGAYPRQIEG